MADNIKVVPSAGVSDPPVATDDIGGVHYQKVKVGWGADGTWNETGDADATRVPVGGLAVGSLIETAPASDTAASGLNGRLQRIAQRLTSLIALLPTALTALGGLKTGPTETVLTCTIPVGQTVSNALDLGGVRNWGVILPATFDGDWVAFQVSDVLGGTYYPLYDITGVLVGINGVGAAGAYDVPGEAMAWRFVKLQASTAQVTTQTDIIVVAKS